MSMNDKELSFKLLSNEWDKVKCKRSLRKSWLSQVDMFKKIGSPRPSLGHKTNQNGLDKQEYEEFEMALQDKSKL